MLTRSNYHKRLKDAPLILTLERYEPLRNSTHPDSLKCSASFGEYWRNNQYIVCPPTSSSTFTDLSSNNNTAKCFDVRAVCPIELQLPSFRLIFHNAFFIILGFDPAILEVPHFTLQCIAFQPDDFTPFDFGEISAHIFDLSIVCHPRPRWHPPISCVQNPIHPFRPASLPQEAFVEVSVKDAMSAIPLTISSKRPG